MESEQGNQENQEERRQSDQEQSPPYQSVRSYECTFCRRGFSNAQALGGHMNIHRRDKAKLKNSSASSGGITNQFMEAKFSEDRSSINFPDKQSDDDDDFYKRNRNYVSEIMQLPLFDDKPSSKDHHQQQRLSNQIQEKGLLSSQVLTSSSEVDLELRLGPEPHDSSPAMAAKSESLPRN